MLMTSSKLCYMEQFNFEIRTAPSLQSIKQKKLLLYDSLCKTVLVQQGIMFLVKHWTNRHGPFLHSTRLGPASKLSFSFEQFFPASAKTPSSQANQIPAWIKPRLQIELSYNIIYNGHNLGHTVCFLRGSSVAHGCEVRSCRVLRKCGCWEVYSGPSPPRSGYS